MKRIFGYIILMACIALYIAASSNAITKKISFYKLNTNTLFSTDKNRYGDLYGVSYLHPYKVLKTTACEIKPIALHLPKTIDLYALGDSYLWSFVQRNSYEGVDKYIFVRTNPQYRKRIKVKLDSTKKNIMLIEMSERNVWKLLDEMDFLSNYLSITNGKIDTTKHVQAPSLIGSFAEQVFNKEINRNIELLFCDTRIFTPIRELKAELNYRIFDRIPNEVKISPVGTQLFVGESIDTTRIESAFKHLSDKKLTEMITKLNKLYTHYKELGFDEVYFSIIPNAVTIICPDLNGYHPNKLIDRIQYDPRLKMPIIDVLPQFKEAKVPLFYTADSHWNMNGVNIWLSTFNAMLAKQLSDVQEKPLDIENN